MERAFTGRILTRKWMGPPNPMFSSVQFSRSVVSNSLQTHESQHARPPCPSPTPRVYSNSCPSSQWYHPAILSSVAPFSSWPQSLPSSGSFPTSQLFTSGGQTIGVSASASVLPMNTQDWSPLGWTGWISLHPMWLKPNNFKVLLEEWRTTKDSMGEIYWWKFSSFKNKTIFIRSRSRENKTSWNEHASKNS